jgi:hypothetical protein
MKPFSDTGGPEQTRGANIPLHQRSDLMMRRMESGPSLTAKLLSNQAGDHENERGITDPLFQGLIDRLPKPLKSVRGGSARQPAFLTFSTSQRMTSEVRSVL